MPDITRSLPLIMTAGKYLKIISADISHSVGAEISLSSYHLALWLGIDFLFTQTVINILSTASWRGVWNIFDIIFSGEKGVFHVSREISK